jgi:hypothetical protein
MRHIVYTSTTALPVTETDLQWLLPHWRSNNARDGITGLLLYSEEEGRFMQVIEGEEPALRALFAHIERDYRHRDLLKLADGPIARRNFTTWTMGFKAIVPAVFAQVVGYIDPTSPGFAQALATTDDALIRHLLATFTPEAVLDHSTGSFSVAGA